jgi:hypothetical protein
MDVRRRGDGVLARPHLADDGPLGDLRAARDADRRQLEQRHRPAVGGLDRQRPAAAGDGAGERDGAGRGRAHGRSRRRADVDAPVLPRRVGVGEGERPQNRPVGGPGPAGRDRGEGEEQGRSRDRGEEHAPHRAPPSSGVEGTTVDASGAAQPLFNDSA